MSLSFGSVTDFYGDDFGLSTDELVKKQMKKEKPVVQPVIKSVVQPIVQPSTRMPHNNIFTSNDFKENFYKDGGMNRLYLQKEQLKKISSYINTPITWYEELYGEDRIQSLKVITKWDLDLDSNLLNNYLNPKHKLKQVNKTII